MASGYSRVVPFSIICGTPACVELPMPPRGELDRLIITQVSGDPEAATINVYDRKGACIAASDLNVTESGTVSDYGVSGPTTTVSFNANHTLQVGDQFEVKGSDRPEYNVIHEVTSVVNATDVVTDVTFTDESTGGRWQTLPFDPTNRPVSHLILTAGVLAGEDYIAFDINRAYENKDNRSETMRSRHSALWLEFLTVGAVEPSDWEVAYTCRADAIV